ncbi:MAG: hypothetical protein JW726_17000 [Anaerolineales bacterium]|nr:hypothetical protein [Anaerolineales bacterium]
MNHKPYLSFLLIVSLLLAACNSAAAPQTSPPVPQTEEAPAAPTETALPAPTATPPPSPTPDPVIFVDEFDGALDERWSWQNEDPARWAFAPEGWLALTAANPGFFSEEGSQQVNLLHQPAPQGDFVITTRLSTTPDENFQQAGIFIIADDFNYVAILNAFCQMCLPDSGGHGFFMEAFKAGEYAAAGMSQGTPQVEDVFLRLVYHAEGSRVEGFYALAPDEWEALGTIEGLPEPQMVALGAGNSPSPEGVSEDLLAFYDYFEVSQIETPVRRTSEIPQAPTPAEPALATLPPEPQRVEFQAEDGTLLVGYYYPAAINPAPVVVLMHWAGGDQTDWLYVGMVSWLQNRGAEIPAPPAPGYFDTPYPFSPLPEDLSFGVFTFDFRGYGESGLHNGPQSDLVMDARAAYFTAAALPGVDPARLVGIGASIGADGVVDGCNEACIGALSLGPGNWLEMSYSEAVTALDDLSKPVWCVAAEDDESGAQTCRSVAGDHYYTQVYPSGGHAMSLFRVENNLQPSIEAVILDFLWLVFGLPLD